MRRVSVPARSAVTSAGSSASMLAPAADELEISLFGPGYGESIAMHLGDARWIIVDSCIDAASGMPAAIAYLQEIGVDCSEQVAAVLATHWHDDHVRGLAEVLRVCERARFVLSPALQADEFLVLVESRALGSQRFSSGVSELADALSALRARRHRSARAGVSFALENTIVARSGACTVLALSPCSSAVQRALTEIADLLPTPLQPLRRVSAPSSNAASIALWLKGDAGTALLGADLDCHRDDTAGWGAVLALDPAADGRAGLLKVPHHGSSNAHDQRMWDHLLHERPQAMLTPWSRGGRTLPEGSDRDRICTLAPAAIIAGQAAGKPQRYDPAVERTLREVTISRQLALGRTGHVRARCGPSDEGRWRMEMVRNARGLCGSAVSAN